MFPEKSSPGGRVYAMGSTGEVEKRVWVATSVSKNYPVSMHTYMYSGTSSLLWTPLGQAWCPESRGILVV